MVEREIAIIVDNREYRSRVVKRLSDLGVKVNPKQLKVGDYIVSPRIGVERKSIDDFLESMIDGKLFKQAMELRNTFARPLLIIEGENLFTRRNISESAIFGGIVSLIVDYGLPIINTKDYRETARILQLTARREQERERREIAMRGRKRAMLPHERQRFIIEGLPNISSTLAKRLLKHFKTIRNLANATEEELFRVPGVGRVTAREILEIFTKPYLER
jgi:Fanconi anemia group M protein